MSEVELSNLAKALDQIASTSKSLQIVLRALIVVAVAAFGAGGWAVALQMQMQQTREEVKRLDQRGTDALDQYKERIDSRLDAMQSTLDTILERVSK